MRKIAILGLFLAGYCLFEGVAEAQTTTCGYELGKWVCRQDPQPNVTVDYGLAVTNPIEQQSRAYEFQQRMNEDRQRDAQAEAAINAQRQAAETSRLQNQKIEEFGATSKRVADLMDLGQCDAAVMAALHGGSPGLAQIAKDNCKSK